MDTFTALDSDSCCIVADLDACMSTGKNWVYIIGTAANTSVQYIYFNIHTEVLYDC